MQLAAASKVHLLFKLTHNFQVKVGRPRRTQNPGTVPFNTVKQGHFLIIWVHLIIPIARFTGLTFPRKKIHKKRSNYGVEQYMKRAITAFARLPTFSIMEAIIPSKEKRTNISEAKAPGLGNKQKDLSLKRSWETKRALLKQVATVHFSYLKI